MPDTGGRLGREAVGEQGGLVRPSASGRRNGGRRDHCGWSGTGRAAGTSSAGIQGQSSQAPGLTKTGREQAAQAGQVLAGQAPGATLVVASDLTRAAQTGGIIADLLGLPLEFDPHLREQALGTLEGEQMSGPAGADGGEPDDVLDVLWDDPFDQTARRRERGCHVQQGQPGAAPDRRHPSQSRLIIVTHGGPVRVATAARPPHSRPAVPSGRRGQRLHRPVAPGHKPRLLSLTPPTTGSGQQYRHQGCEAESI